MTYNPFVYIIAFANIVAMIHLGLFVIGANLYDMKQFKKAQQHAKPRRGPKRKRWPMVSVVVPAHNEELVIERTINSILASSYEKFEIIIIDDNSKDKTPAVVRNFIKKHPQLRAKSYIARYDWSSKSTRRYIRGQIGKHRLLFVSQKRGGKGEGMNNAIANHVRGELVMCLDADTMLHPEAIARAVRYFDDRKVIGVAANVRIMSRNHLLTIVQQFEHMIGYRAKKFYNMINGEFVIGGVASTYRTSVLKRYGGYDTDTITEDIGLSLKLIAKQGNRNRRVIYASDVVAMTEAVQTFHALLRQRYRWKMGNLQNIYKYRQLVANSNHKKYSLGLTMYRLPMAIFSEAMLIIQPLIILYIIFLCIHYQAYGIIFGAYFTLTLYVLWTIWPDEHLNLRQKLRMSSLSFVMYGLFYVMDVVQLYAAFSCILERRRITQRDIKTSWASPMRSGQAANFSA